MKRIFKILVFMPLLVLALGCGREDVPEFSPVSYIFFDSQVETKAELVSDMKGEAFGVTGFKYKGVWSTVRGGEAKPNLFCGQEVVWNGTSHAYTPMQQWEGDGMKYTFFAYYPYGLTTSGSSVDGEPYVDFTFDASDMMDLMTSYKVEDVDNTYSNSVGFTMKHRLAALDVYVANYMDDANGQPVKMKVSNLVFKPELKYSAASFWMDPKYKPESSTLPQGVRSLTAASSVPTFDLGECEIAAGSGVNVTDSQGKTMIVIPQKDGMEGTVSFDFAFFDASGNSVSVPMMGSDGQQQLVASGSRGDLAFTMNKDILEGQRYYLQIIFINGLVTLEASAGTSWEDKDIDIEFE